MENEILIEDCCRFYSIETSFVKTLNEHGLINLKRTENAYFIHHDQLSRLEKYMHFHYDLDINVPGIEAISHLLENIESLQQKLRALQE